MSEVHIKNFKRVLVAIPAMTSLIKCTPARTLEIIIKVLIIR